jgi:hypothetical protein
MPIITPERASQIRGQLTEKYGATWMHHYHEAIEDAVLQGLGAFQVSVQNSEPVIQHLPADDSEGGLL